MSRKGERKVDYHGKPKKLALIAGRLGVDEYELLLAILAECPYPKKGGVVTLSVRPMDQDYDEIRRREQGKRELVSVTTDTVRVVEQLEVDDPQLRIPFEEAIIGAPNEGAQ